MTDVIFGSQAQKNIDIVQPDIRIEDEHPVSFPEQRHGKVGYDVAFAHASLAATDGQNFRWLLKVSACRPDLPITPAKTIT
jgi:hypothetical protein